MRQPAADWVRIADLERDPHPVLARLRRTAPVAWVPALSAWYVTGHALVARGMRDDEGLTVDDPRFSTGRITGPSMLSTDGPEHARTPRELHPVFFGSYDWHSCVHGHWTLARLLRRFPAMAPAGEVRALLDAQLVPGKVAGEVAYLERPSARGFERPYGWAWLLLLAAELERHERAPWAAALRPLNGRPPFRLVRELARRVQADSCVEVDTNHYSVPWRLIGAQVSVEVGGGEVRVSHAGAVVARHKVQ